MDAPVSPTHHNTNYNVSDISSATRTKRRTRSITTSRECTPRLSALISETRRDHPPVYYLLGTTHAHGRSLHRAGVWGGTLAFVHVQVERDWTCKQRHWSAWNSSILDPSRLEVLDTHGPRVSLFQLCGHRSDLPDILSKPYDCRIHCFRAFSFLRSGVTLSYIRHISSSYSRHTIPRHLDEFYASYTQHRMWITARSHACMILGHNCQQNYRFHTRQSFKGEGIGLFSCMYLGGSVVWNKSCWVLFKLSVGRDEHVPEHDFNFFVARELAFSTKGERFLLST